MTQPDESITNGLIDKLQWAKPAQETDPEVSLDKLLIGLRLLATDDGRQDSHNKSWDGQTLASVQVIDSGALAITTYLTKRVRNAGGLSAFIVLASGGLATILKIFDNAKISNSIIVTLFGGAFVLLSATAIALALLVKGDLLARGNASAARHSARGQVAAAFLQATATLHDASNMQQPVINPSTQAATLWVRPTDLLGNDATPWRPVLSYSKTTEGDPPQEVTLYLVQLHDNQEPDWLSIHEFDGWKVSATYPES